MSTIPAHERPKREGCLELSNDLQSQLQASLVYSETVSQNKEILLAVVAHMFKPNTREAVEGEVEASLVYKVSSRRAKAVLKNQPHTRKIRKTVTFVLELVSIS